MRVTAHGLLNDSRESFRGEQTIRELNTRRVRKNRTMIDFASCIEPFYVVISTLLG
jgi:hypothetical protein